MTDRCQHYFVSGRVQGVGYRYFVVHAARALGIRGWARNLRDGRVELVGCGDETLLAALEQRLWQGPPASEVTDVVSAPTTDEAFTDFAIR